MRHGYALPIAGVCLCFIAGCTPPPTLVYKAFPADGMTKGAIIRAGTGDVKDPATTNPADPADGEFVMAKQVSTVVLSLPDSVAKSAIEQKAQDEHPADEHATKIEAENAKAKAKDNGKGKGKGKGKKPEPVPPASPPATPTDAGQATTLDVATDGACLGPKGQGWTHCFDGVQTTTAPHIDMSYIFAVRQGDSTSLDVTTGTHPLQVTAVTSDWTNTTAATFTRLGSEATLGYAAGGPIGAAVVVVGGELFGTTVVKANGAKVTEAQHFGRTWNDAVRDGYVCPGEATTEPKSTPKASLLLPVALDLDNSLPTDDTPGANGDLPKFAGCWHRFPQGDKLYRNQGWLYRVVDWTEKDGGSVTDPTVQLVPPVLDERKPGASADKLGIVRSDPTSGLIRQTDANALAKASPKEAWIPASACHAVHLQVTYADEIIAALGPLEVNPPPETPAAKRFREHHDVTHVKDFDVVIADPRWNQLMRVTEGKRTITFGQCGGTAKGTQGGSEIPDDVKAAAELVKTVKGLQSSGGKSGT